MSGDRGWEDLFGSLDDGESAAEPAEQGTTDPDPFGFDLPPAAAAPVTPTPAPAVPYVLPEPAGVADPPADPFAEHSGKMAEGGPDDTAAVIAQLQEEMVEASRALEFERAALLRDQINELKALAAGQPIPKGSTKALKANYISRTPKKKSRR